jgi:hypothetical protein
VFALDRIMLHRSIRPRVAEFDIQPMDATLRYSSQRDDTQRFEPSWHGSKGISQPHLSTTRQCRCLNPLPRHNSLDELFIKLAGPARRELHLSALLAK